jgi:PhoH-like ATPase
MKNGVLDWNDPEIMANEYCVLSAEDETHVIGRYERHQRQLVALNPLPHDLWSIKPRNIQQRCALDLLLREDVKLVTLVGQAGTGKTLLALACALRKVFDEGTYSKILVSRPIMPLGKDIGFLPGSKEEKLFHWMQPIYDNLEYLCHASSGSQDTQENLRWIKESQKLELEAVTYIRGRTLPNMFIIIDEAQNLTPHEIKTVISRAGEGTKVILAGDPSQIDNPYLDVDTNGLTFAISKFGNHPIFGNMFFDITERSELSSLAAEVL